MRKTNTKQFYTALCAYFSCDLQKNMNWVHQNILLFMNTLRSPCTNVTIWRLGRIHVGINRFNRSQFGLIWLTFRKRALFQHFSVETQSVTPGNSPYANYSHKKIITECFFNSFNSGLRPFEKIDPNRTWPKCDSSSNLCSSLLSEHAIITTFRGWRHVSQKHHRV